MTELLYEQPLNEKIRQYLRLEYLAKQLQINLDHDHQYRCFYPLFALCDLIERCDYRGEVLKDIDRQLCVLSKLQRHPTTSHEHVAAYIDRLSTARDILKISERPGLQMKQDRFLSALRQRFNMPGVNCNFDLPQLHFWLAQPWEVRQAHYQEWISQFACLLSPINLLLELIRQTSEYTEHQANAGFYQANSDKALSLIRVRLTPEQGCYPTISGHKKRYAIHFMQFDKQQHCELPIQFELATCS